MNFFNKKNNSVLLIMINFGHLLILKKIKDILMIFGKIKKFTGNKNC